MEQQEPTPTQPVQQGSPTVRRKVIEPLTTDITADEIADNLLVAQHARAGAIANLDLDTETTSIDTVNTSQSSNSSNHKRVILLYLAAGTAATAVVIAYFAMNR